MILLWITPVVQVVLAVMYMVLVVRPFYMNGLDELPAEEVASGLHDPAYLHPFCYTLSDVPGGRGGCADGTQGNPNGRSFFIWAAYTACGGPWIGGGLTVMSTMTLLRSWERLRRSSRLVGMIGVALSFGTFILMSHQGALFMIWFMD
jgi:hypothetical protein